MIRNVLIVTGTTTIVGTMTITADITNRPATADRLITTVLLPAAIMSGK
jgi:hypothetical protein